jgi:hypothetical protein
VALEVAQERAEAAQDALEEAREQAVRKQCCVYTGHCRVLASLRALPGRRGGPPRNLQGLPCASQAVAIDVIAHSTRRLLAALQRLQAARVVAALPPAVGGRVWARSHCRFVPPPVHFIQIRGHIRYLYF